MNAAPVTEQAKDKLLEYLADTSRHVDVMSPLLEPALLDDDDVANALTRLARRGRQTRIRLLTAEIRPLLESGHRLIALSRRLPTAMTIQVLEEHPEWQRETLMIFDRSAGFRLKAEDHQWEPELSAPVARRESDRFDRLWRASQASPELRQL